MKSILKSCLAMAGVLALAPAAVAAQGSRAGAIKGDVLSPAGKVLAGAHVTVVRAKSNTHLSMVTGTTGEFAFKNLPPGDYRVTANAKGFAPMVQPVIEVTAGKTTHDTVMLKPPTNFGG